MKVLVCDDRQERCKAVVQAISESAVQGLSVLPLSEKDLDSELKALFDRVDECLNKANWSALETVKTVFDDHDLIILDNNLAHLQQSGRRLTAEGIVGYIRAFTKAPYVVSLNKNPDVDFDLRYLIGDYATRADLALNESHLTNLGLWNGQPSNARNGFLPWYWPKLLAVSQRRRDQISFVESRIDSAMFKELGFPSEAFQFLSLHALGALSSRATASGDDGETIRIEELTFREVFLSSSRSLLDVVERQSVSTAQAAGVAEATTIMTRVIAADVDLWFRRDGLAPQEALVDIPHLLMRFPFLLGKEANDLDAWDRAVVDGGASCGLEKDSYEKHVRSTRFAHECWTDVPCFWWPLLKSKDELNERLFEAKEGDWLDAVFCEDRSRFLLRSGDPQPVEFSAEFEGSWGRRFVVRIDSMRYAPLSRFAI